TAEASNASKSRFLANTSHEVRTPMTAILRYVEMLDEPDLSEADRRTAIDAIRASGEHLLSVINDILDVSKIEAGEMTVERIECSPSQIVSEVASVMRVRAAERRIKFNVECRGLVP